MTYSEPLFNQISRFVSSIGFGFVICVLYLVLVILRTVISDKKWAIITQDIIFGVLTTVLSFFFMVLYNNGEVRWNLVLGEALGGGVLYYTVGRHILSFMKKPTELLRRFIALSLTPLKLYISAFPKFFKGIFFKCKSAFKNKEPKKKVKKNKENTKEKKKVFNKAKLLRKSS